MLPPKARLYGVATALLVTACRADQPISPNAAPAFDTPSTAFDPGTQNYSADDTSAALPGRRFDGIVLVPSDTVRMPGEVKLSRSRRQLFTTTNASVASVDQSGLVRAGSTGSATVVSSDGSKFDTLVINVEPGPARIVPSPSSVSAQIGEKRQIVAAVTAATGVGLDGHSVRFSVQNPSVATVSSAGLVTAVAGGQTVVMVTDGATSASIPVTVEQAPPAFTATSLELNPDAPTLLVGATQQFTATPTWSDGAARSAAITYTATGGTVSVNGLFTAGSIAGQFRVIALCVCGVADTSNVTITAAPSVQSMVIAPKTVTLAPGATQTFTVSAQWSNGSTAVPLHVFTASAGSVTAGGVFTAPTAAGTYRVIVAERSGPLKDTAVVTVVAPPANTPATPPPPPPAGALFTDSFESGGFSSRQNGIRWTSVPWVEISAAVAHTGSKSVRFRQGESGGWAEMRFDGLPKLSEVFVQFYLYMPSGAEQPSVGPRVRVPNTGAGQSHNDKFFRLWGGDPETLRYGASTWYSSAGTSDLGIEYRFNDGASLWAMGEGIGGVPKKNFVGNPAYLGRWIEVRIRCKVASAANNDGAIQIWLDGDLVVSGTNLATYALGGVGNYFEAGYLLGWANNGFPVGQSMYLDDFSVSGTSFPSR